ncbi:CD1375 family protein [Thalassobacillus sp. C254]|nr:CD1375 family protein [Thalassobacillus sp. C254]
MVEMYVTAVQLGFMEFEEVPDRWKERVKKELESA